MGEQNGVHFPYEFIELEPEEKEAIRKLYDGE